MKTILIAATILLTGCAAAPPPLTPLQAAQRDADKATADMNKMLRDMHAETQRLGIMATASPQLRAAMAAPLPPISLPPPSDDRRLNAIEQQLEELKTQQYYDRTRVLNDE